MNETKLHHFSKAALQDLFAQIAKSITSSLEIETITSAVMEHIELFFKPRNWSLLRVDPTTQELFFVIAKGINPSIMKTIRLKIGEGIAGHVAQTGESLLIEDVQKEQHFTQKVDQASGFTTQSIIAVPIIFQKNILGVIELINLLGEEVFTRRDLMILETIADFTAIALTNAITFEQMTWIATHDPLTGLYNRAQLEKIIQSINDPDTLLSELQKNTQMETIVVWIDIDNFKEINDHYDHLMGDRVLVEVANLIKSYCNNENLGFRVGGDEFLVIFQNIDKNKIEEKINILKTNLTFDAHHILPASGFSFGIASGTMDRLPQLIKEADRTMYLQKAKNKELSPPV